MIVERDISWFVTVVQQPAAQQHQQEQEQQQQQQQQPQEEQQQEQQQQQPPDIIIIDDDDDDDDNDNNSNDDENCLICKSAERTFAADPCGHYGPCSRCLPQLLALDDNRCPFCRTTVRKWLRVFQVWIQ